MNARFNQLATALTLAALIAGCALAGAGDETEPVPSEPFRSPYEPTAEEFQTMATAEYVEPF
jgi:hypothetical protein